MITNSDFLKIFNESYSREYRNQKIINLINNFGAKSFLHKLWFNFSNQQNYIIDLFSNYPFSNPKKVNNIIFYYHRMSIGGIEKSISNLSNLLINKGYNVTILVDEKTENIYSINKKIKLCYLSTKQHKNLKFRISRIFEFIKSNNIDLFIHCDPSSNYFLLDFLIAKLSKVYFVSSIHTFFSSSMIWRDSHDFKERIKIVKMCDAVHTLSQVDSAIWESLGAKSYYIPNVVDTSRQTHKNIGKQILWIGRIEDPTKGALQAIKIFDIVSKKIQDATLIMVGDEGKTQEFVKCQNYIAKNNLNNKVIFTGFKMNIKPYYQNSCIYINTAYVESFSLTIAEAISNGLPVISFKMPYLELLRDNKGVTVVDNFDIKAYAKQIINLLNDNAKRTRLSNEAYKILNKFSNETIYESWVELFNKLKLKRRLKIKNNYDYAIEAMLVHYLLGVSGELLINETSCHKHSTFYNFYRKIRKQLSNILNK